MGKQLIIGAGLLLFCLLLLSSSSIVLGEEQEIEAVCTSNSDCGRAPVALCCGGRCFDKRKWNCVEGRVCNITSTQRCAGSCYETELWSCHFNRTLCKIGWNLCNQTCHDPKTQYCANNNRLCLHGQWYCAEADKCYDPRTQFCCAQKRGVCNFLKRPSPSLNRSPNKSLKPSIGPGPGIIDLKCCPAISAPANNCPTTLPLRCGSRCYNPGTSACVNKHLVCKLGAGVCNERCYNTTRSFCPDSIHLCSAKQWYCPEASRCFDPLTQVCCAKERRVCLKSSNTCCVF